MFSLTPNNCRPHSLSSNTLIAETSYYISNNSPNKYWLTTIFFYHWLKSKLVKLLKTLVFFFSQLYFKNYMSIQKRLFFFLVAKWFLISITKENFELKKLKQSFLDSNSLYLEGILGQLCSNSKSNAVHLMIILFIYYTN